MGKMHSIDVVFEHDKKPYTARFSTRAMGHLQDYFKIQSLQELVKRISDFANLSVNDLTEILWASLIVKHPDITKQEVLAIADEMGVIELSRNVSNIVAAGLIQEDEKTNSKKEGAAVNP